MYSCLASLSWRVRFFNLIACICQFEGSVGLGCNDMFQKSPEGGVVGVVFEGFRMMDGIWDDVPA